MAVLSFLETILSAILIHILHPMVRHISYPIKVGKEVKALRDTMKELKDRREDVLERISMAERESKKPTHQVQGWLRRVETIESEAIAIGRAYDERSCKLLCWTNYRIGKRATKKLKQAKELYDKGGFDAVAIELSSRGALPLVPVQEIPTTSTVPGLESNLEEAIRFLGDSNDEEGMLGIWGMGGVGKTTLLTKINNSLVGNSTFDHVIWIVAARDCSTEKVQSDIARQLGLLIKEEDTYSQSKIVFNFLRNKNFVLLLDDLWEPLDLKKVGIPHPLGISGQQLIKRKVILTTRFADVCGNMEAHKRIRVECLNWEAGWHLFKEKVGEEVISSHPEIQRLAERVAAECDGLPLALITVGRAMSTKRSPQEWEYAIKLLRASRLPEIPGTEKNTFPLLKFSYDSLESNTLRECFLCCSLWPEDFNIRKDELIECWMGLDLIDEFDDIDEAYHIGHCIIGSLLAACLLEPGEDDEREANMRVKMHDVIRDMALWIASDCGINKKKWMVHTGVGLREAPQEEGKWREAQRISLAHNKLRELASRIPTCPNLTALMLQHNNLTAFPICHVMQAIRYLDLSYTKIEIISEEIGSLVKLQYLNLSFTRIRSLPESLKCLINLKYLLLRGNGISAIAHGLISNLKKLRVLDLSYTHLSERTSNASGPTSIFMYEDHTTIVQELECLEGCLRSLGICVSKISDLEKIAELSGIPTRVLNMKGLEGLTNLHLLSPELIGNHNMRLNLKELTISYCPDDLEKLIIEESDRDQDWLPLTLETLNFLKLINLKSIIWKGVTPKELLPRLSKVTIVHCINLKSATWLLQLPCLEYLELSACYQMKQVIDSTEKSSRDAAAFLRLRTLILRDMPELHRICYHTYAFLYLEYVEVSYCPNLVNLPFQLQSTSTTKLRKIRGQKGWWKGLQWKDDKVRVSLLPFFEVSY